MVITEFRYKSLIWFRHNLVTLVPFSQKMDPLQDETFHLKLDNAWHEQQETPQVNIIPSDPPVAPKESAPLEITTTIAPSNLKVEEVTTTASLDASEISMNDEESAPLNNIEPGTNILEDIPTPTLVNNPNCCELAHHLIGKNFMLKVDSSIPLSEQESPLIIIDQAGKSVSSSGKTIIAYEIRTMVTGQILLSKHRYSDFEGLREIFLSSYNVVVPPIPSKHSVADYASKPGKAKMDANIIAKRKRMLQIFLLRVASDPILQGNHAFHLFLTDETPWNAVVKQHLAARKRPAMVKLAGERTLQRPGISKLIFRASL